MFWTIDRFENDCAVLECGEATFNVPISALPERLKEGDVLAVNKDSEKTAEKRKSADDVLKDLFGR